MKKTIEMKKKIINILFFVGSIAYMVLSLGFVNEKRQKEVCNKVEINILNDQTNKFLKESDILRELENYNLKLKGVPIDSINTLLVEKIVSHIPVVNRVYSYITINGKLVIEVEQRNPLVRLINNNLQQFIIYENGKIMPLYRNFVAHTLIANGNIEISSSILQKNNLNDSSKNIISDIYKIANYINNDAFWKAQIEQLYVNSNEDILLIPRIGNHIIIIGDASDIELKFQKLKAFYRTLNEIGWNKYKTINLKYKNQIVCKKI